MSCIYVIAITTNDFYEVMINNKNYSRTLRMKYRFSSCRRKEEFKSKILNYIISLEKCYK